MNLKDPRADFPLSHRAGVADELRPPKIPQTDSLHRPIMPVPFAQVHQTDRMRGVHRSGLFSKVADAIVGDRQRKHPIAELAVLREPVQKRRGRAGLQFAPKACKDTFGPIHPNRFHRGSNAIGRFQSALIAPRKIIRFGSAPIVSKDQSTHLPTDPNRAVMAQVLG